MKILIAGASGFIGRYLIKAFTEKGYNIIALSRSPQKQTSHENLTWKKWREADPEDWQEDIGTCAVVINLVGESIAAGRWTKKRKKILLESRVNAGEQLVEALRQAKRKPGLFIQASAIGYYASAPSSNEKSPPGKDFLAQICIEWEKATEAVESMGCQRIILRSGVIVAPDSQLIKKFKLPFSFFIGGHLGSGRQIMSWIHIDDVVNAILFMIDNLKTSQVYNLTAPNPVTMKEFCMELGKRMKRPSWLPVPVFVLKLIFGQLAEETMLKGHKVLPANLLQAGYSFKYEDITGAFNNL